MFVVVFSIEKLKVISHVLISSESELRLDYVICSGSDVGEKFPDPLILTLNVLTYFSPSYFK